MFGKRAAPQGASFNEPKPQRVSKARDQATPFLRAFQQQADAYVERARRHLASGDPAGASYWAGHARRAVTNRDRIEEALQ